MALLPKALRQLFGCLMIWQSSCSGRWRRQWRPSLRAFLLLPLMRGAGGACKFGRCYLLQHGNWPRRCPRRVSRMGSLTLTLQARILLLKPQLLPCLTRTGHTQESLQLNRLGSRLVRSAPSTNQPLHTALRLLMRMFRQRSATATAQNRLQHRLSSCWTVLGWPR